MKPRVVILGGAGAMGRIAARDLARYGRRTAQVVIADRMAPREALPGVESVRVDATDRRSLERVLRGAFAVIASLPYPLNPGAMIAALSAGAHYVDLGGLFHVTRRQLELQRAFERRGRMAILGMGSAPGILNVLAVLGARGMSVVREVHCLVGAVDRTRVSHAPALDFGYAPDTLLDEFAMPSAVFRDGAFVMVPPLDPRERITVRFPQPVGTLEVDATLHSEVATLPLSFADRGIREVTFRQAFTPEFRARLEFLSQLGLTGVDPLGLPAEEGRGGRGRRRRGRAAPGPNGASVIPRQVLLALVRRSAPAKVVGRPRRWEVLRTVVRGRRGGRALTVTCDCHAGPRSGGGAGPDADTGAPPSIVIQLMLGGEMPIRPGVWAPEQVVPVEPFVRELRRRSMPVTRRSRAA